MRRDPNKTNSTNPDTTAIAAANLQTRQDKNKTKQKRRNRLSGEKAVNQPGFKKKGGGYYSPPLANHSRTHPFIFDFAVRGSDRLADSDRRSGTETTLTAVSGGFGA